MGYNALCAVEQRLARQAHNLEVVGSIPTGATPTFQSSDPLQPIRFEGVIPWTRMRSRAVFLVRLVGFMGEPDGARLFPVRVHDRLASIVAASMLAARTMTSWRLWRGCGRARAC